MRNPDLSSGDCQPGFAMSQKRQALLAHCERGAVFRWGANLFEKNAAIGGTACDILLREAMGGEYGEAMMA